MYRCIAQIDREAMLNNLRYLQQLSGARHIVAMVKANAYGHGLKEIASILQNKSDISFGVAEIEEGIAIRKTGANNPILLFDGGASASSSAAMVEYDITPIVSDLRSLQYLERALKDQKRVIAKKIHLKIDTGFIRLGIDHRDLMRGHHDSLLAALKNPCFILEGLATHFSTADHLQNDFIDEQIRIFRDATAYLNAKGLRFSLGHLANSAAILRGKSNLDGIFSGENLMIRPGLAFYGIHPFGHDDNLQAVLSVKAQIVALKRLEENQGLGYGHSFISDKKRMVAIVAIGYGDGLRRSLSNRGYFLWQGQKLPLIGSMSMDSSAVDVTAIVERFGVDAIKLGDMVTVLGKDKDLSINATSLALLDKTIPYEILTSIAERLRRQIV